MVDKDRIKGSFEQAKGKFKEVAGKVTGDSKLEGEGKADQVAGKRCGTRVERHQRLRCAESKLEEARIGIVDA